MPSAASPSALVAAAVSRLAVAASSVARAVPRRSMPAGGGAVGRSAAAVELSQRRIAAASARASPTGTPAAWAVLTARANRAMPRRVSGRSAASALASRGSRESSHARRWFISCWIEATRVVAAACAASAAAARPVASDW